MREIKFRAWDRETDQMIFNFGLTPDEYFPYQLPDDDCESPEDPANYKYFDDAILMQYTGLKDKNGKEIYEGDLFRSPINYWEVVYRESAFRVKDRTGNYINEDNRYQILSKFLKGEREVIGNIYENGDLLK